MLNHSKLCGSSSPSCVSREDIGNRLRAFFEERIQSSSGGLSIEGCVYGISGEILNPRIDIQGSVTLFEGNYSMATLSGRYIISRNGVVRLDYLRVGFQPNDVLVCGTVVGALVAGCAVQVTLGYVRLDYGESNTTSL